jgi:hypothetical protein
MPAHPSGHFMWGLKGSGFSPARPRLWRTWDWEGGDETSQIAESAVPLNPRHVVLILEEKHHVRGTFKRLDH